MACFWLRFLREATSCTSNDVDFTQRLAKRGRYLMDTPKYQKSDPAILLLNEIDILLAQTRLMELYLKQAQATAANEKARLHETL